MNTPPQPNYLLVVAGGWVILCGLHFCLGVFSPKHRHRHGRANNPGPELSTSEHAVQAALWIGARVFAIVYALH